MGAPLGNSADASPRLISTLTETDVIAAEDTRRLRRLAHDLGITLTATVVSYFDGNERERGPMLLERLRAGEDVAVISDGGMPVVSDPGFRLVRDAIADDIPVTAAPGPSAVTTALALSGLPCDRFCFEGFLPRKVSERHSRLADLASETRTMVFFESPRRIGSGLESLIEAFGSDRPAALCRELTKTYEDVRRGSLAELADGATHDPPRGEITLVVAGDSGQLPVPDTAELAAEVQILLDAEVERREAMSRTAKRYGIPKREVYDAVLAMRRD